MRTRQALRALRAQQIIGKAYGIRRGDPRHAQVRFELLGDAVALAVVRNRTEEHTVVVKVARQLPDGRVTRLLKESRRGFENLKEQILYFEALYERYGSPG